MHFIRKKERAVWACHCVKSTACDCETFPWQLIFLKRASKKRGEKKERKCFQISDGLRLACLKVMQHGYLNAINGNDVFKEFIYLLKSIPVKTISTVQG